MLCSMRHLMRRRSYWGQKSDISLVDACNVSLSPAAGSPGRRLTVFRVERQLQHDHHGLRDQLQHVGSQLPDT